jgi:ANTAR domain/GAF domain
VVERSTEIARLQAAVAAAAADGGRRREPFALVCHACVELLSVDGASISLMTGEQHRETLFATDPVIDLIEELQFTLGEGPCFQAFHTGRPVLVPDLSPWAGAAWPVFASAIADQPVQAVFAFPIGVGAIRVGVLDMYRREPGLLEVEQLVGALQVVDVALAALLWLRGGGAVSGTDLEWPPPGGSRWEVHQATGMVMVQLGVSVEEAFVRLRAHAFAAGRLITEVAQEVVEGRLRLDKEELS